MFLAFVLVIVCSYSQAILYHPSTDVLAIMKNDTQGAAKLIKSSDFNFDSLPTNFFD